MALSKVHNHVWKLIREIHEGQNKGAIPSHDIGPGDWVWVKWHQSKVLEPRWKGPYIVLRVEGESSPVKSFKTETRPPGGLLILLLIAGAGAV